MVGAQARSAYTCVMEGFTERLRVNRSVTRPPPPGERYPLVNVPQVLTFDVPI